MRDCRRCARAALRVSLLLLVAPRAAYADNCSGLSDCYGQIATAAAVVVALALLGLLAFMAFELIALGEAAAAATSAAIAEAAAAEVAAEAAAVSAGVAIPGQTPAAIAAAIKVALASSDRGVRFEGQVAATIQRAGLTIINFQRHFGPNGSIGEIDVEMEHVIVEATIAPNNKLGDIVKLMTNPIMNPSGKPVVLIAPNYRGTPAEAVRRVGAYVAKDLESLIDFLKSF